MRGPNSISLLWETATCRPPHQGAVLTSDAVRTLPPDAREPTPGCSRTMRDVSRLHGGWRPSLQRRPPPPLSSSPPHPVRTSLGHRRTAQDVGGCRPTPAPSSSPHPARFPFPSPSPIPPCRLDAATGHRGQRRRSEGCLRGVAGRLTSPPLTHGDAYRRRTLLLRVGGRYGACRRAGGAVAFRRRLPRVGHRQAAVSATFGGGI